MIISHTEQTQIGPALLLNNVLKLFKVRAFLYHGTTNSRGAFRNKPVILFHKSISGSALQRVGQLIIVSEIIRS